MSYNPFDDLPQAVKQKAAEEEEVGREQDSKRRKVMRESDFAEAKEDTSSSAPIKTEDPPEQPKRVDVSSTLQTLRKHIFNSKKQAKALQLLLNLAESELNETNCTDFFHILKDFFVAEDRRLQSSDDATAVQALSPPTATIVDKLISLYFTRSNLFCNIQRFQLQNCRACQVVSDLFDCDAMFPPLVIADYSIDNSESSSDDFRKEDGGDEQEEDKEGRPGVALRKARTNATLACMTATLPLYSRSLWAKQPLDKLFAAVAQRRLLLPPDQREQLDDLTTKITTMRRKAVSGKPDQTVRAFNSTAHPLKTKKVGLLR